MLETRKVITLGSREICKLLPLETGFYLLDIAKNPMLRNKVVFLLVDEKGEIDVVMEGMPYKNNIVLKFEVEGMPPSQTLIDVDKIVNAERIDIKDAYFLARETLMDTVVFNNTKLYDLVTVWCMYTWLRGLFPKNINLYIVGFPATGKSQVLKFCKLFSRYPVDYDPTAEKSYKWAISHTLGVLVVDEAEYISKVIASKLRKYHETNVVETRLIGLPLLGLTSISLRVDAPLVLSATHPPSDTAFLQRGFIIRMVKGTPKIKDYSLIPDLEDRRLMFMKSIICNWSRVFQSLTKIYYELTFGYSELDERVKDLAIPVCTMLEVVGEEWDWVIDYAKYSFSQANFITPETTAFIQTLVTMKGEALRYGDKYILPVEHVSKILRKVGETLGANPSRLDFLRQYLFAGCEIGVYNNQLVYICDKKTVDDLVGALMLTNVECECERVEDDFTQFLKTSTRLVRTLLAAIKNYVIEYNLEYKFGTTRIQLSKLKPLLNDRAYRNMSYKTFKQRVFKSVIEGGVPEPLRLNGINFIVEDDEIFVIVDLDRFKKVVDKC